MPKLSITSFDGLSFEERAFFEKEGLLSPCAPHGASVYLNRDLAKLKLIQNGKRLGFSLSEIADLMRVLQKPEAEAAPTDGVTLNLTVIGEK